MSLWINLKKYECIAKFKKISIYHNVKMINLAIFKTFSN